MRRALRAGLVTLTLALGCEHAPAPGPVATPRFIDVTEAAGIARSAPTYDATVGDFDGDGRPDVYVGNHATGAVLLRNLGDGRFADVRAGSGIDPLGDQHGTGWTDYDNDGRLDLVVTIGAGRGLAEKANRLYHNDGGGRFHDVGVAAGVADPHGRSRAAAWLDVDNDGWLDLVIANYASPNRLFRNRHDGTFEDVSDAFGVAALSATRVAWADVDADGYPDLLFSGTPKGMRLLRNDAGRRFVDVTDESGLGRGQGSIAGMAFGDADGDGVLDLYVAIGTDFSDVVLAQPDARITFAFFAHDEPSGFDFEAVDPARGVEADLYEIGSPAPAEQIVCGRNGHPATSKLACGGDAAVSAAMPDGALGYAIWRNPEPTRRCVTCAPTLRWHLRWRGAGDHHQTGTLSGAVNPEPVGLTPQHLTGGTLYRGQGGGRFEKRAAPGLSHDGNGQAVQWADVDNDGALDLYVVDSGVDGAGGQNLLFMNGGRGGFVAARESGAGPSPGTGRGSGAHFLDFDGDGSLDLFLTNGWGAPPFDRGPYYLLRNESAAGHWLALDLEGTRSNRPGLGTWVELEACGVRRVRYHNGAASYFSQSIVMPHVGLGSCAVATRVRLRWPSGVVEELRDVAADRVLHVREGD